MNKYRKYKIVRPDHSEDPFLASSIGTLDGCLAVIKDDCMIAVYNPRQWELVYEAGECQKIQKEEAR